MNRLILIGNGFDLAHGLKTDYNSFILWYLKKCFNEADNTSNYEDGIISIKAKWTRRELFLGNNLKTVDQFIDYCYENGFGCVIENSQLKISSQYFDMPFVVKVKSKLLEKLILTCSNKSWVDIENQFYEELKNCLPTNIYKNTNYLEQLNNSLAAILEQLEIYLISLPLKKGSSEYSDLFNSLIIKEEIIDSHLENDTYPNHSLILNFNYTKTVDQYLKKVNYLPSPIASMEVNHIHGEINDESNPLIFGFGDELDEDYQKMEHTKANGFFEYIKSFWYFKTSNYHDLIRFIDSRDYQIYIIGHSCGLSDRTLLNMIFEHPYCKSIKIFYHGDKQKNNYKRLTQEISRHFRDKVALRRKIVPFNKSSAMPQVS